MRQTVVNFPLVACQGRGVETIQQDFFCVGDAGVRLGRSRYDLIFRLLVVCAGHFVRRESASLAKKFSPVIFSA